MTGLHEALSIAGEGAIVTCPRCHRRIGVLRKPLYQHWTFGLDAIEFYLGMGPHPDRPYSECRKCGTPYAEEVNTLSGGKEMLLHIWDRWVPHDPPPTPLTPRPPLKPAA